MMPTSQLHHQRPVAQDDIALSEYQEAFAYFDHDRDGRITKEQCGQVLRAVGHAPTEGELQALYKAIDRTYGGYLTFDNFVRVVSTIVEPRIRPPIAYADTVESALRTFQQVCRPPSSSPGSLVTSSSSSSSAVTTIPPQLPSLHNTYTLSSTGSSSSSSSASAVDTTDTITIADIQLLLTRHGDTLSESALLQLLKIIKPNKNNGGGTSATTTGNHHRNTSDLASTRGELLSSGKMVFLPGPRSVGMLGRQKSTPGQQPSSSLYLSEGYERLDITEIVDRLMRGGRIMK